MSERTEEADFLLAESKPLLEKIRRLYENDLERKQLGRKLKREIKTLLGDLRSVLDYYAVELYERFVPNPIPRNIYFPISRRGDNLTDFRTRVNNTQIRGLNAARPDLVDLLASFQEFSDPSRNGWMPDFATLCNENKHERLTPQNLREEGAMTINDVITFAGPTGAHGLFKDIVIDKTIFAGLHRIGPGMPRPNPAQIFGPHTVRETRWTSAIFTDIGLEAMIFLRTAVNGVERIINELKRYL